MAFIPYSLIARFRPPYWPWKDLRSNFNHFIHGSKFGIQFPITQSSKRWNSELRPQVPSIFVVPSDDMQDTTQRSIENSRSELLHCPETCRLSFTSPLPWSTTTKNTVPSNMSRVDGRLRTNSVAKVWTFFTSSCLLLKHRRNSGWRRFVTSSAVQTTSMTTSTFSSCDIMALTFLTLPQRLPYSSVLMYNVSCRRSPKQ